jgi:hypothetical protein
MRLSAPSRALERAGVAAGLGEDEPDYTARTEVPDILAALADIRSGKL